MPANPVIVVPGITANYLNDQYPLPPETIWSVLSSNYERAGLHPDNIRYEAGEPALVRGGQLFELCYRELIEELRHNLTDKQDEPVPVYPFSYDWRQPLRDSARELAQLIDEVIARTKLMKHYYDAGYPQNAKINLVGHSMGGLIILTYLQQQSAQAKVERVATLATPFRGSFESVIKIATGTANLGTSVPSSREREAARMTPSLYCLMPDLPNAITAQTPIANDLFNSAAWQPSVVQTIEEYVRLHGVTPSNPGAQASALFGRFLSDAKALLADLAKFKLADAGLTEDDWLCVMGVDAVTRVKLNIIKDSSGAPQFDFRSADRENHWSADAHQNETGDGTVPYDGALPHFLPAKKLVCVSPDDYGYWELEDKLATKMAGFHGILPNMDMLHRLITRYFKRLPDQKGNTWGRVPIGVSQDEWDPPLVGGLEAAA
jgi:pimeloyl-ACP methyl ester carboxylesterase